MPPATLYSRWVPRKSTVVAWLTGAAFLRPLNAVLRRLAPVLVIGKRVFVSRHSDVVDALSRDTEFTISEINAVRTNRDNGAFVLSMDRGPQHDREKDLLNSVMPRQDVELIRTIVSKHAEECVRHARPQGWLDVVGGLTRIVPLRLVGDYFGVPGPGDDVMLRWMRALFQDLFLNLPDNRKIARTAEQSFEQMCPYLLGWIAHRKEQIVAGGAAVPDDVLTRMLRRQGQPGTPWLDDDCVRRNISGLIVGAVDTTSAAAAKALDQLLKRPAEWAAAREAALSGDDTAVARHVFEALRFNPHNPVVIRHSQPGATLGRGTPRQRTLPAGKTVFLSTLSGMYDPSVFTEPGRFRADREAKNYLHFSSGMHACQGHYVSAVQIPLLVAAVLRLKNVRRAPGWDGRIAYDGPFPDRMMLEFDA